MRPALEVADVFRRVPRERAGGSRLAGLPDRVRAALDQDWPIERLAAEAAVSSRALHRRFQEASGLSPAAWLLGERLARARELLDEAALPVDDVVATCGFGTAVTVRYHFRAVLGIWVSAPPLTAPGSRRRHGRVGSQRAFAEWCHFSKSASAVSVDL